MNNEMAKQIADWIEFFRDLGFEDFYRGPERAALSRRWLPHEVNQPVWDADGQSAVEAAARLAGDHGAARAGAASEHLGPVQTSAVTLGGLPPQTPIAEIGETQGATPRIIPASRIGPTITLPAEAGLIRARDRASEARSLNLFEAEPAVPRAPERETLEQIRIDLGDCHRCKLAVGRKHIVFGQGSSTAELVFVGEGPGADEDEQGLPFVGRAGQLLNRMLQRVDIRREDVYICNVVKCRPPGNRTPEKDEVDACAPFLFRQIQSIRPRLVCCLGIPAVRTVLGIKEGITRIHGRLYDYGPCKAMATVHPAYVLRNPREERILIEDFQKIRDFVKAR